MNLTVFFFGVLAVKDMASNLERRWRQMLAPPKSEDEGASSLVFV